MDLNKTNFINSANFLPPKIAEKESYAKICNVIDQLVSDSSTYFSYEKKQLNEVINKYKDYDQLASETIHQMVAEFGYQYIIDILELPESNIKNIVAYLALINILKGSKRGLELVLSLLGLEYNIIEWFEDRELLPRKCTYALELTFVDTGFKGNFYQRFDNFTREYVYPILVNMISYFKFTYGKFYTGWAEAYHPNVRIYYDIQDILVKYCDPAEWFMGTAQAVHPEESILWDDDANQHVHFLQPGEFFYGTAQSSHPNFKICYDIQDILVKYQDPTIYYEGVGQGLHPEESILWDDNANQHVHFLQPGVTNIGYAQGLHPVVKIDMINEEKLEEYTVDEYFIGARANIHPSIKLEVKALSLGTADDITGIALGMHQSIKILSNKDEILEEYAIINSNSGIGQTVHPAIKISPEN